MNLTSYTKQPLTKQNGKQSLLWRYKMWLLDWFRCAVMAVTVAGSLLILPIGAQEAQAADYTAGSHAELVTAINNANADPALDTITLTGDITLTGELPYLNSDIDIVGDGFEVNGADTYRVFFVRGGTVNFSNMTITDGLAQGGTGGPGAGGGAGLGGGLFVYDGTVTTQSVNFGANRALGGNGGTAGYSGSAAGMGGNGAADYGGGGGLAYGSNGAIGDQVKGDIFGGNGGGTNGGAGGSGGSATFGAVGGFGGGGGGGFTGGAGGFGGGGGGGYETAGAGGFGGGGGGAYNYGGNGGFGGGGGGFGFAPLAEKSIQSNGVSSDATTSGGGGAGTGGYGAGNGGYYSGGGGLGGGGGLFVRAGTTTLIDTHFAANRAQGGDDTSPPTNAVTSAGDVNGQGHGGGIFICTADEDASCSAVVNACNVTFETSKGSNSAEDSGDDVFGTLGACPLPEIAVIGDGSTIADGDTTPFFPDDTHFGTIDSGTSVTHTFTISNSGMSTLTLTGSPLVTVTSSSGEFAVPVLPAATIAAGLTTTFDLVFAPTGTGEITATVAIENNDSDESPYDFWVKGFSCPSGTVLHVDADATGAGSGLSWTDAMTTLQDALSLANTCNNVDEIWVAEGVYYPDDGGSETDNDRESAFALRDNFSIYGGFGGTETMLSQRNWEANLTILSGDLEQNDVTDADGVVTDPDNIVGTNALHVVVADYLIGAVLDGFVITAGAALDTCINYGDLGGGFYNMDSVVTLENLLIIGNTAILGGGLMTETYGPFLNTASQNVNAASANGCSAGQKASSKIVGGSVHAASPSGIKGAPPSLTVSNVTFSNNHATDSGGGVFEAFMNSTYTDVSFVQNSAENDGGGLLTVFAAPALTRAQFVGNSANAGGGYYVVEGTSASLTNALFTGNSATTDGGAIFNEAGVTASASTLALAAGGIPGAIQVDNATFSGNVAGGDGGAIKNVDAIPLINNSIIWNNQDSSGVGTASASINNAATPPLVVRAAGGGNISYSVIQGSGGSAGWDSSVGGDDGNNFDTDPLFVADVNLASVPTSTASSDLQLSIDSLAINAGNDAAVTEATDLNGADRIIGTVDLGAYESTFVDVGVAIDGLSPASAEPGDGVSFTISFSNTESITATNVAITNALPAGLTAITYTADLDGSITLLSDPNSTYEWTMAEVPPGASGLFTISAEVDDQTAAGALAIGVTVTATNDARTINNSASTSLTVLNVGPTANAGFDIDVATDSIGTLNGTQSSDLNGDVLTYGWVQTGGQAVALSDSTASEPTFTAPSDSTVLTFTLTVTDTGGLTSTADEVVVSIRNEPIAGLAVSSSDPTRLTDSTTMTATITAGSNALYTWDFGDGNGGNGAIVEHTYAAAGTYTATVTVENDATTPSGATPNFIQNTMTAEIVVEITNSAPVADAGPDQTVEANESVILNSSATADSDNHLPMVFAWVQTAGPAVALSSASDELPTFTAPDVPTTLAFELTVTDSQGLVSATDSVNVTVNDVAIAGLVADNDSPTEVGHVTTLNATIMAGTNVVYTWNFGDGNSGSGATVNHTYAAPGDYIATVTVANDANNTTATTLVEVTNVGITDLNAENDGPTQAGDITTLMATITAGDAVSYSWNFGDGNSGAGITVTHAYAASGIYTATVTASNDTNSLEASTIVTVTSDPEPDPIVGLAATNDSPTEVGNETTLNATITSGTDVNYSWDFGDGNNGVGATTSHSYAAVGTYTATVTASNAIGTFTATTVVEITEPAGPEAIAGLAATNDGPTILGSATTLESTITAGADVSYSWDFGDGNNGNGQTSTHTYSALGVYTATVSASNATNSQTATTVVTITDVNQAPNAVNDDTHTLMDVAVSIDVILNDRDPNGDALTVVEVGEAQNGTVVQNGSTALYTPNSGFIGRDSFSYTISDGRGETASARVNIRVVEEVNEVEVTPESETRAVFETQLPNSDDREAAPTVQVEIVIPAGSVTDTTPSDLFEVDFAWVDSSDQADPPDGLSRSQLSFSTEAFENEILLPEYNFNGEIVLTLTYDPNALEGLDLSTLQVRLWDPLREVWTTVGVRIISNELATGAGAGAVNELVVAATQTGEFAIFGQPLAPTSLDEIEEPMGQMDLQLYLPVSIGNGASNALTTGDGPIRGQSESSTSIATDFLYLPIWR